MGRCLRFVYGGCRGNANNFASERDCLARCEAHLQQVQQQVQRQEVQRQQEVQQHREQQEVQQEVQQQVQAQRRRPRSDVPTPSSSRCEFGGRAYHLGQALRLAGDNCTRCECDQPPSLTCTLKRCPTGLGVREREREREISIPP